MASLHLVRLGTTLRQHSLDPWASIYLLIPLSTVRVHPANTPRLYARRVEHSSQINARVPSRILPIASIIDSLLSPLTDILPSLPEQHYIPAIAQ